MVILRCRAGSSARVDHRRDSNVWVMTRYQRCRILYLEKQSHAQRSDEYCSTDCEDAATEAGQGATR